MTELMVALDFESREKAQSLVRSLAGLPITYKVGLELFTAVGPSIVSELKSSKFKVFLDLKLHDIPNTVAKAACSAARLQADYLTLHLSGGHKMFAQTVQALETLPGGRPPLKILGVSVLTSHSESEWKDLVSRLSANSVTQSSLSVAASVGSLASEAEGWGCGGIVCSSHELEKVKQLAPRLFTVVPGIRLEGHSAGDQARVMTPGQAAALGASAIVVGRAITEASDPRGAAEAVLEQLHQGKTFK